MNNMNKLTEMCEHISKRELLSSKAQRDSIKIKQAEYLMDKVGTVFQGIVSGVTEWGLYVELSENKCEGIIKYNKLEGSWKVDIENYLIQNGFGEKIRLGDNIMVSVLSVDLEKKQINFKKL